MTTTDAGEYKIGTICRLSGFTPELLRSWERRYDLLSPKRGQGKQRLYSKDDLTIILNIKEYLAQGLAIGEISRYGRDRLLVAVPGKNEESNLPIPVAIPSDLLQVSFEMGIERFVNEIVDSAIKLDKNRLEQTLNSAFSIFSPELVIHDIIRKSAICIGQFWQENKCSVAGEHLASSIFLRKILALQEYKQKSALIPTRQTAICTCFPEERHAMSILMVAHYLANFELNVIYLDGALPFADLETALYTIPSDFVCLSTSMEKVYQKYKSPLLEIGYRWRGKTRFFVGGLGVPEHDFELHDAGVILCPGTKPIREYSLAFFNSFENS